MEMRPCYDTNCSRTCSDIHGKHTNKMKLGTCKHSNFEFKRLRFTKLPSGSAILAIWSVSEFARSAFTRETAKNNASLRFDI